MTFAGDPVQLEIVVPAYNEARRLPRGLSLLLHKLRDLPVSAAVVVVDNASTDETSAIARGFATSAPVRVLHCAERGKGAAVRMGLLATSAPYVGFCDADMATDLESLDDVLRLLVEGHSMVVGSRRHPESVVEEYGRPLRRMGAIIFNRLVRDLTGGAADTQCGFKFFSGPLVRAAVADLRTPGFAFDVELLMHCIRHGGQVTDLPVVWRDVPGTTFSVRRHTLRCARDLARIRANARRFDAPYAPPRPLLLSETQGAGPG
ncbi:glycosyltransferase [Actinomadura sp. HBU206391]|uniref:glycosyltransferase n=1 Tax=Actinomadura sp. HBU206391 TaxID=2731692 RepID=UPI0016503AD5|nr:glycosyltransferase [Actinomadura sp. HBU206391]MBC6456826.1 glycosyltransferase [Actinomadura sp. HBU206391]